MPNLIITLREMPAGYIKDLQVCAYHSHSLTHAQR